MPAATSQPDEASDKAETGDADGSAPAAAAIEGDSEEKEDPDVDSEKKDEAIAAKNEAAETESTSVEAVEPAEL